MREKLRAEAKRRGLATQTHRRTISPHFHQRERRRCERSFRYFLTHYVHTADDGGTKIDPWPWQQDLAKRLPGIKRLLVLKARQLGLSWIAAAYALWVALFHRGALVLLLSQTEDDAIELKAKVQLVYDELPSWLKPAKTEVKETTQLLKFKALRSSIVALPSTRRAGRGRTAKLVVADEHAFHQWAEANFTSLDPTVEAGGQFLIISTADGIGNTFADLCAKASNTIPWVLPHPVEGRGFAFGRKIREAQTATDGWLPLFIPYDARPGRDADWWQRKKDTYPREWMIHQEYPRDPEEAFVQTGRPVFVKEVLDKHKQLFSLPLIRAHWPSTFGDFKTEDLRVFESPQPGHRYFGGADVAEGLEHGDYSSLSVFDADASERPKEVLTLHGHWEPDLFAYLIHQVALVYRGIYGIERNNHGHTVVVSCRKLGTPGLYRERPVLTPQGVEIEPGKLGWLTSTTTKPLMIDELSQALREFSLQLSDELAYPELVFYQTNKDGSTGAPSGKWDDRVMALAIANQMRKHLPPRRTGEERGKPARPFAPGLKMNF